MGIKHFHLLQQAKKPRTVSGIQLLNHVCQILQIIQNVNKASGFHQLRTQGLGISPLVPFPRNIYTERRSDDSNISRSPNHSIPNDSRGCGYSAVQYVSLVLCNLLT